MLKRWLTFYSGVWIPISGIWTLAVVGYSFIRDVDIFIGLLFALAGPAIGLIWAPWVGSGDPKGSVQMISSHPDWDRSQLFKHGLRKGCIIAPISLIGVVMLAMSPMIVDKSLTLMGR